MGNSSGRLAGKVAIITGASTGTGPVMAKMFVDQGAKVVLCARKEDLVLQVAKDIGPDAIGMRADVTNEDDVRALVERAMDAHGQVDILLNNASVPGQDKYVWEQTVENWNYTIGVILTASMLCTREVLNHSMLERKSGSIVNFSSTAAWPGMPRKTHYTAAKGGLRSYTKSVALEVGQYGIRCNCLHPGGLLNEGHPEAFVKNYSERTCLGRLANDSDLAGAVVFLASDASAYITGVNIPVDGGYTAK